MAEVEIIKKETMYKGFYQVLKYQLRHGLFAGGMSEAFYRELIVRYRVAAALPYDPVLNRVVLIKQFRIGALENERGPWLWEVVAGVRTDETESLENLAVREAQEEAGVVAGELIPICDYWVSPGGTQERVALFLARVNAKGAGGVHGLPEEHEDILVKTFSVEEAFAMVRSGEVNNALTIIALQWLQINLDVVKQRWKSG